MLSLRLQGYRGTLRYMEDPPTDGKSIDNVSFVNDIPTRSGSCFLTPRTFDPLKGVRLRLRNECTLVCDVAFLGRFLPGIPSSIPLCNSVYPKVHHSSGIVNKAFVKAARECAAHACASSLSECVFLMGNLFLYTNVYRLNTFSIFVDAARETCNAVDIFFAETKPTTSCTRNEVTKFVEAGWSQVGLSIDRSTCAVTSPGCVLPPTQAPAADPSVGCSSASSLSFPSTVSGSTAGQTRYLSQRCLDALPVQSAGVWYSVQGTGSMMTASLCGNSGYDSMVGVSVVLPCLVASSCFSYLFLRIL